MTLRQDTPPSLINQSNPSFDETAFDASIWNHGYDIVITKAIRCPCKDKETGKNLSTCQNCRGVGWFFINPIQTKGIITGINDTLKYKAYSPEFIGDISLTIKNNIRLSYMDKVTFKNDYSIISEDKIVRNFDESNDVLFLDEGFETEEDWTLGGDIEITGGVLSFDNTTNSATYNNPLTIGNSYKITLNIGGYTSGSVRVLVGSGGEGETRTTSGTFIETIVCLGSAQLIIEGVSSFTGSVESIKVEDVTLVTKYFTFLSYEAQEIEDVFVFQGSDQSLIRLTSSQYSINSGNGFVLDLDYDFSTIANFSGNVGIRYKHELQHHVVDLPHDLRRSFKTDVNGKQEKLLLPVNAICRVAHQVLNLADYDGDGIKNNSYL